MNRDQEFDQQLKLATISAAFFAMVIPLIIVNFVIIGLFEDNVTDIIDQHLPFFVPQVSFALWPEPVERIQFFVTLILFGLGSFHTTKFVKNRLNGIANPSRVSLCLFMITFTIVVVLMFLTLKKTPSFIFFEEETIFYRDIRKMFHSAVDMKSLLVTGVILFFLNLGLTRRIAESVYLIFCGVLLTILFFVNVFDTTNYFGIPVHFNAVFYSLDQVVKGKTLLVNLTNQYGLYPHFLEPFFQIIRLNSFTYSLTFSLLTTVSYGLIYIFLFRSTRDHFVTSITLVSILYLRAFSHIDWESYDTYFQYTPIRFFFPCLLLVLVQSYLMRPSRYRYHFISFVSSVSTLWNFESGIVVFLTWILVQIYEKLAFHKSLNSSFFRSVSRILLNSLAMLAMVVAAYCYIMFLRSGEWLNIYSMLKYQEIFYVSGFFMMHMPVIHFWNLVIFAYSFGFIYAIYGALTRTDSRFDSEVFLVSILGFGLFWYYQGRSHDYNLLTVIHPAIILLGFALFRTKPDIRWNSPNGTTSKAVLAVFVLLSSLALSSLDKAIPRAFESFKTMEHAIMNEEQVPAHLIESVEFIKSHTAYGEKVIMLLNEEDDGLLYNLTGTVSALPVPGGSERILIREFEEIVSHLNANISFKVFSAANHFFAPINQALDTEHLVLAGKGDVKLFFPKRAEFPKQFLEKPYLNQHWNYGCSSNERLGTNIWRWCESQFGLLLENVWPEDLDIELSFDANTGFEDQSVLLVSGPDFKEEIWVSNIPSTFRRRVSIKKGKTFALNFYTDAKKLDAPMDPRSLHLRITNFNLKSWNE